VFYKLFDSPGSIKDADPKQGIVTGYLAHFGTKDSDGDIIVSGAFAKTIAENGPASLKPRIKHLLDHRTNQTLGVFTTLKEDLTGLYYESKIGGHNLGVDFLKMAESGLITEHSIGYRTIKGQGVTLPENNYAYQLQELALYEGSSLQFWGANPNTPLTGIKSAADLEQLFRNLETALKSGTFTNETFKVLQAKYDQLAVTLKSVAPFTEPVKTTQPIEPDYAQLIDRVKSKFSLT
jgi:HK97 family phage prohead protease